MPSALLTSEKRETVRGDDLERDFVKALGHPLRLRLLETIIENGEESPVRLARQLDQPLSTVSRHIRMLRDLGFVELTRTEPRRGTVERFYRALHLGYIHDEEWERLPVMLRRGLVRQTFRKLFRGAAEAGAAGGFDSPDAHLDVLPLRLDAEGRTEISAMLHRCLLDAQAIQRRSDARRSEAKGEAAERGSLALLHYMSPRMDAGVDEPDLGRHRRIPSFGDRASGAPEDGRA